MSTMAENQATAMATETVSEERTIVLDLGVIECLSVVFLLAKQQQ